MTGTLGHPRLHLRSTGSTNDRARALAAAGAPSGTLVTASEQTAGRGRQGRDWVAPPGSALLMSVILRWPVPGPPPTLLPLIAAVAVCDAAGQDVRIKWPNDIVLPRFDGAHQTGRRANGAPALAKLAGILVEGRPQEGWAVLGIGVNVAVPIGELPAGLRHTAASLERDADAVEPFLAELLQALERRLVEPAETVLAAWRARDALRGRKIEWEERRPIAVPGPAPPQGRRRSGHAQGVDKQGQLLVRLHDGTVQALSAGEVHLGLSV